LPSAFTDEETELVWSRPRIKQPKQLISDAGSTQIQRLNNKL
jgi:hypothetical protein